jgi:hypothetical protein
MYTNAHMPSSEADGVQPIPFISVNAHPPPVLTPRFLGCLLAFMAGDEAKRPRRKQHRKALPMVGRQISIQGGSLMQMRGSDRTERIYVCVVACRKVREASNDTEKVTAYNDRGDVAKLFRISGDFLCAAERVRRVYNMARLRHPWKEALPNRDLLYDGWLWRFELYKRSVAPWFRAPLLQGIPGARYANDIANRWPAALLESIDVLRVHDVEAILGEDAMGYGLDRQASPTLDPLSVKGFLQDFFREWRRLRAMRPAVT